MAAYCKNYIKQKCNCTVSANFRIYVLTLFLKIGEYKNVDDLRVYGHLNVFQLLKYVNDFYEIGYEIHGFVVQPTLYYYF